MLNTMVFTTVFSKSMAKRLHRWLLLLVFLPFLAWTAEIDIVSPQISATDDGYTISADFNFELNQRLEEAVTRGLMLYFVAEFELSKERWYWFDEKLVSRSQTYRLSYHALTRQYRLAIGSGLHQSFSSLPEALAVLSRLRRWQVIDKTDKGLRVGEPVEVALRFRLDVAQLPKPFQITSLGNKDWSLASDWKIWQVSLPAIAVENK